MRFQAEDAGGAREERWETPEAHGLLSGIRLEESNLGVGE